MLVFGTAAQEQSVYWANLYGGQNPEIARSVDVDADGNIYVTGTFNLQVNMGALSANGSAQNDIFVAKISPEGVPLWLTSASGLGDNFSYDIGVDSDGGVFICGKFKGTTNFGGTALTSNGDFFDAYTAKLDNNGTWLWARKGGGPADDSAEDIAVSQSGIALVTGYFHETAFFQPENLESAGETDVFIASYTTDGSLQWIQEEGGESWDAGWGIHLDSDNNIFVTGEFIGEAIFDTITVSTGNTADDMFLARYNIQGDIQWVANNSSGLYTAGVGLDTDEGEGVYVSGFFEHQTNFGDTTLSSVTRSFFIGRYDYSGNLEWVRGGVGGEFTTDSQARSVACNDDNRVYLAGYFNGDLTLPDFDGSEWSNSGNNDAYFITYDDLGNPISAEHLATSDWDVGFELVTDEDGRIYYAGGSIGDLSFLGTPMNNNGVQDIILAKISPCVFPATDFAVQATEGCESETISMDMSGSEMGVDYFLDYEGNILDIVQGTGGVVTFDVVGSELGFGIFSVPIEIVKEGCAEDFVLDTEVLITLNEAPVVVWSYLPGLNLNVEFTDETAPVESTIDNWFWEFGDGNFSIDQSPDYQYDEEGVYNVCLTIITTDGCTSMHCEDVVAISISNSELESFELVLFPNPADDFIYLDISGAVVTDWSIRDVKGAAVMNSTNPSTLKQGINIEGLSGGMYWLELRTESQVSRVPFIVR
jgi:hypothetical protein